MLQFDSAVKRCDHGKEYREDEHERHRSFHNSQKVLHLSSSRKNFNAAKTYRGRIISGEVETLQKPAQTLLGEKDGRVYVNSAQGNRGVTAVYEALMSAVASDGSLRKEELMARVASVTGETPPMDKTIFGRMAIHARARDQLYALTGEWYTDAGVRKMTRSWDFLERTAGLDWTCVGSLDFAVRQHVISARAQWQRNLAQANEARRGITDQSPRS